MAKETYSCGKRDLPVLLRHLWKALMPRGACYHRERAREREQASERASERESERARARERESEIEREGGLGFK
jgi:hypothetical protein